MLASLPEAAASRGGRATAGGATIASTTTLAASKQGGVESCDAAGSARDLVSAGGDESRRGPGAEFISGRGGGGGGLSLDGGRQLNITQPISGFDGESGGLSLDGGRRLSASQPISSGSGDSGGLLLVSGRYLSATEPISGGSGGGADNTDVEDDDDCIAVYHVATSTLNPLNFTEFMRIVSCHFRSAPLVDRRSGAPIVADARVKVFSPCP